MRSRELLALYLLVFLFALTRSANAAENSLADQFLGSPLIILVAIIVIDIIAFIYHKVRR